MALKRNKISLRELEFTMVRAFSHQCSMQKSKSFHFKRMFDNIQGHGNGRNGQSASFDVNGNDGVAEDYKLQDTRTGGGDRPAEHQNIGWVLKDDTAGPVSCLDAGGRKGSPRGKPSSGYYTCTPINLVS